MNGTICLLITCLFLSVKVDDSPPAFRHSSAYFAVSTQTNTLKGEVEAIFEATNQQRARKGLPALKKESKLMIAAQQYADLMATEEQMSHSIGGLTLPDKAKRVGYAFRQLSENIALNSELNGSFVVVEQWMKSTGHRKNLLANTITDIGIGVAGPSKRNHYY